MKFKLKSIHPFDTELKALSKKYPSLKKDYEVLIDLLKVNPTVGSPVGKTVTKFVLQ